MSNTDPIRWQQRLQQFEKASGRLSEALQNSVFELNELEQEGLIQRFEYTFELAWKTLKDLLFYEGFDLKSPRESIRQAFESGYLNEDDTEVILEALNKRNQLSHTYKEFIAHEALKQIEDSYGPALHRLLQTLQDKRNTFA